ncbi:hypothetical protein BCR39DRAFT_591792 [Naematelia encephala]|uniref:Uncharacterized protein n=1 Tax=Naematelia encephala TaxID=71784 RepID=A0A1Y2ADU0_9TREE|nr:hypothetical protein BCR39DRAFT_591792 [Naematelia encephala]
MSHHWHALNYRAIAHFQQSPDKLRDAWGWGVSSSTRPMKRFIEWFEDVYYELIQIIDARECYEELSWAALGACQDILELDIPTNGFIKYLVRIRHILRPNAFWDDWPCDVTGMEESDDEDELIFDMDD